MRKYVGKVKYAEGFLSGLKLDHETSSDKRQTTPCYIEIETSNWLPHVNLDHLTPEQKEKVEAVLVKYNKAFSRNGNGIGKIEKLQLDIKVTDKFPVHKAYRRIPKQLYQEVKDYLENLELNG